MSAGAHFGHSSDIWRDFPALVPGVLAAEGVTGAPTVDEQVARFERIARARLATSSEGELPEIRAWRRTFTQMGLKPTQYRCASEALLRRFRKEGSLPRIHSLVDLCNAISLAYAIPVAAFDRSRVAGCLEVRYASGDESYVTFAGDPERPEPGEVIFADDAGHAHARRWTNRQSGSSAVREQTNAVLVVAEAMHASAPEDIRALLADLACEVESAWGVTPRAEVLSATVCRFEW